MNPLCLRAAANPVPSAQPVPGAVLVIIDFKPN
jgi:hypothetical protein